MSPARRRACRAGGSLSSLPERRFLEVVMVSENFELVLEGLSESTPDSLRRVKGTLLSDLGLTVAEAQAVLESLPFTLFSAPDEDSLQGLHDILAKAGAKVQIVRPQKGAPAPLNEAIDFFLEGALAPTSAAPTPGETEVIETGLDFFVDPGLPVNQKEAAETSAPITESTPIDFSLELAAPPELPQLKDTVVQELEPVEILLEPIPEERESEDVAPLIGAATPDNHPLPASESAQIPPPAPLPAPRLSESPHSIPIGRRMREHRPTPQETDTTTAEQAVSIATSRTPIVTAGTVGLLVGGTILLGLLNWLLYRL